MKKIACLFALLLLCGCVYDVPLVEKAEIPVDPALTGIWQMIPDEGEAEDPDDRLMILPFSKTEYLAVAAPGDEAMYFRAYPVRVEGMELIQLKWLQVDPEEDEPYHVCRYKLEDEILTVAYLNKKAVSAEIKDSAALRAALLANRDNPDLFDAPERYRELED